MKMMNRLFCAFLLLIGLVAVRGESPASTETVPAPAGQGAIRVHTGSMCPNRNAVRRDAGTVECRGDFCHGLVGSMTAETSRQPGREIVAPAGDRPARVLGQARTEAEYEAFVALKSALGPLGKAESAQDFLERFPLSGLSPLAHQADRASGSYARGGPGRIYVVAGPSASRKDLQAPPPSPTG